MTVLMVFRKLFRIFQSMTTYYGYLFFRLLNIILFPTFIITFLVFELEYLGFVHIGAFKMIIYIICFLAILCYYTLQVITLIYSIFLPSNSVLLITTSIENKFELPARFYQAILAFRKLIFAILIVYGRNKDQVVIYLFLFLSQIVWLAYLIKFSPLKYRFANITCWINEATLAVLLFWTLVRATNIIQRDSYYEYVQIMLRFPLGTIFIILYFITYKLKNGCIRKTRIKLFPYNFQFGLKRIEVYDQFGRFHTHNRYNSQNRVQNPAGLLYRRRNPIPRYRVNIN